MKLIKALIDDYRSIKSCEFYFSDPFQILVGLNESGKSNILRALSFLENSVPPSSKDVRFPNKNEEISSRILFVFKLSEKDIQLITKNLINYSSVNGEDPLVARLKAKKIKLSEVVALYQDALLCIKPQEEKRYFTTWAKDLKFEVLPEWRTITNSCPPDLIFSRSNGKNFPLKELQLIEAGAVSPASGFLTELTTQGLASRVEKSIKSYAMQHCPKCVFWKYSDDNLLPDKISVEAFTSNADTCVPLKRMFELAGVGDIASAIKEAKAQGVAATRNLLERVSVTTTRHIRKVWKECRDLEILLELNGNHIDASVRDRVNRYEFAKRSDGFKRFISFLLSVSASVRADTLTNTLLLIDEPEIGLHPSGIRYLRDELIKISETNLVVASTHSIFMIDKTNLGRHRIIKKTKEVTEISVADKSNFMDEEVIYNALGYSIFENLKKNNILLEGWCDKQLFIAYLSKCKAKLKEHYKSIGVCHIQGVKDTGRVIPMLELANREYTIVSDNDAAALEAKQKFTGSGVWLTYAEVLEDTSIVTCEDFIIDDSFVAAVNKHLSGLGHKFEKGDLIVNKGKIASLKSFMKSKDIDAEKQKQILKEVKNALFRKCDNAIIKPLYGNFLERLAAQL